MWPKAAVDWLVDASMGGDQLWVHLMGGEPFLAWDMIEKLVPYAKLRAATFGAAVQFGVTTNLTLVTPGIVEFSRRWGIGWHCSIDGVPEMQDAQRPLAGGSGSSKAAERGAKLILDYRPTACARATVMPQYADRVFESLLYFESIGFLHLAFAAADEAPWTDAQFAEWDRQWGLMADHTIRRYREGKRLMVAAFDWIIKQHLSGEDRQYSCGAGRGSVMVDYNGDLWPCHRWDGADLDSGGNRQWCLGNIFEPGFHDELHLALLDRDRTTTQRPRCARCPLQRMCAGGCPAANLVLTGDIYRSHPKDCRAIQVIYPHAKRVYDTLRVEGNQLFREAFYGKADATSSIQHT